ncbi:N-acetylneuraminic acid synthetase [Candidatus Pelagibacter sp. HTCC7211]|uniref:pseudaminic acid synthase n=3 Tax=Pseudomonadota TaxID=1224 RepID=UPI000183A56E|nr:pseudaminic acid synthase [Candidatus Pelagibacter sp. HTCC7211]EDZ60075.1 N-acetylneuraminic acid synthetase [Candidatus Pelagibacter sp. HTCC7211]MBD1151146.1 pseudaminic acid synthase [Pelagibacterales bacterium SAG-MED25]
MKIFDREITIRKQPFIIAEISANHNNSMTRTLKIIREAKKVGAHAIKLQSYNADSMTLNCDNKFFLIKDKKSLWYKKNLYDLYKKAALPYSWYKEIFAEAKRCGIICFSTPFDENSVDYLDSFDVPAYKIASFENNHIPLIEKVIKKKKPIIISLGATTEKEIKYLYNFLVKKKFYNFAFLQCTSSYPAKIEDSNIKTILDLKKKYKVEIGLSDHTPGIGAAVASISYGATIIEKHFTLDKKGGGFDDIFSMDPDEFRLLVNETKNAWLSLGKISYELSKDEQRHKMFKRSIFVAKNIKKNEKFTKNNLKIVRPSFGLDPIYFKRVIGKKSKQNLKFGTPLEKKHL